MKITSRARNLVLTVISSSAIVLLAAYLLAPYLFNRNTPGSFEYIRKGEALLEKGRYADAIGYYEKAYESSPESEAIKNGLIYAYSTYAIKMAESEKYDMGIEYLSKAYGVVQSVYTRQNLALMYAKRAVFLARRSDRARAQEDLDAAREIADGSVTCERNLGIALFNDAVEEFKAARDDAAILLLKEAVLVYADSRIYEFLGDIYYRKTELEKALFYFDKAAKLDPDNKTLAEKRGKAMREKAVSAGQKTDILPYFDLRYEKGLPVKADLMANILERAYFDVGADLSYFPSTRTVVFLYSEKDFREIFKMRDLVRAFYDGNIRIPLPGSVSDEKELVSYLYHEYTHAIISAKANNNCPVWLSEGIAVYEEIKWTRPGAVINIPASSNGRSDISIEALDRVFRDPDAGSGELVSAYILACTAVEYMVDNWGMKGLDGVLDAVSSGRHAVNAIDDEFLLSEKEFNKRWSDFVMKKYVKKQGGENNG